MANSKGGDRNKEIAFQYWYSDMAKRYGLPPDPNDPRNVYDYKTAFDEGNIKVGEGGELQAKYRTPNHPDRFKRTDNGRWFDTAEDKLMPENVNSMLEWFVNRQKTAAMAKQQQAQQGQPQGMPGAGGAQGGGDPRQAMMQKLMQAKMQQQGGGQARPQMQPRPQMAGRGQGMPQMQQRPSMGGMGQGGGDKMQMLMQALKAKMGQGR